MNIDVAKLDKQMAFLKSESDRLNGLGSSWAARNAVICDEIRETLRQLRQDKQMTGLGGKRLSDNGS